jgi:hypothetical protein
MEMQSTTTHLAILVGGPADGLSFPIPSPSHRCVTLVHPSHPDRIHHYHLEGDDNTYHYFDTVRASEPRADD